MAETANVHRASRWSTNDNADLDGYDLSNDPVALEIVRNISTPPTSSHQNSRQLQNDPAFRLSGGSSSGDPLSHESEVVNTLSHMRPSIDRRPSDLIEDMVALDMIVPSPPTSSHSVNPATIPIRTSSSQAFLQGEGSRSLSSRSAKHKSLGAVPEDRRLSSRAIVDERSWLAQGRQSLNDFRSYSMKSPTPSSSSKQKRRTISPPEVDILSSMSADMNVGLRWSPDKENILKGPFDYLESHPGKDMRSELIDAFNEWLRVPFESMTIITRAVGMLHTASLLIDDVEDDSTLRRGIPVTHSIFGTAQTINSANYIYFCALQELLKLNNPECVQIYTEELLNLHRGQGMDLFWRDTLTCPTEDDYLEMVGNKTGGLFRLAIKLMCAESPSYHYGNLLRHNGSEEHQSRTDFVPLVDTIGLLFQILDDYKNLSDTQYTANKGLCEDLTEGKFSFPIIHAIRSDPSNLQLINILKQKTRDDDVKRFAVAYMEKVGSFSYTRRVLRGLTKRAFALVDEVDVGQGKADKIRNFLEKLKVDKGDRNSKQPDGPSSPV